MPDYLEASVDPNGGSTADNGKLIFTPGEAADNLNRFGVNFTYGNYGALDDGVLTYGFWTYEQFLDSYFFELRYSNGEAFNDDAYYAETYGLFEAFTAQQQATAAAAIELWDDLIAIDIEAAPAGEIGDIMFGAAFMSTAAGAHAYYPQAEALDNAYGSESYGLTSGDVMINWYYNSPTGDDAGTIVNRPAATQFSILDPGSYGWFALTHELGHSFGLAHGGTYNASDDNDGDGEPDPITYDGDAYFYQDSHQYTIMSYFDGSVTGAGWVDWQNVAFVNPSTPMVHDILAVQNVYGADMETRAGDTTYGFNSNAGNIVFDFTANTAPVVTIWDGGGNDTLDLSGWNTDSLIDINEGAFSSASHGATLAYLKAIGFLPQSYTQAQLEALFASYNTGSQGQMTDNIAIAYGAEIENAVGGGGDDLIIGNALDNVLTGNDGDDVLVAGAGRDELLGGAGNDIFVFDTADATDKIRDFTSGSDMIDLTAFGIDAGDVKIAGNNLFADTDGDGGYDLHVVVQGDKLALADLAFVDSDLSGLNVAQTEYLIAA